MKGNIITVPIRRVGEGKDSEDQDLLAVEEPLEIRLEGRSVAITMRTPGNDAELAAGFLRTEGILHSPDQIAGIAEDTPNTIAITLRDDSQVNFERLERHFYVSSSCGICGKASLEAIDVMGCSGPPRDQPRIDPAVIHSLPEKLRSTQAAFDRTGGLHAAGLFDASGNLLQVREDVGRHNALDKVIGRAFLDDRLPLSDGLLMVSGRASFELVQKALMAGIPAMAAVGAPSSLAVQLALRFGMTLAGFVRHGRFNIYSGANRFAAEQVETRN